MAWLKCPNTDPVPDIPVGTTYTNNVDVNAPISGYQTAHDKSEIIDTRNVVSMTVSVNYSISVYANDTSALPWTSQATNESSFVFKVNDTTYLSTSIIRVYSDNDGEVKETGSGTYTLTDLPLGECEFEYDVWVENISQNGEQLDTHANSTISFTIDSVVYKT